MNDFEVGRMAWAVLIVAMLAVLIFVLFMISFFFFYGYTHEQQFPSQLPETIFTQPTPSIRIPKPCDHVTSSAWPLPSDWPCAFDEAPAPGRR